MVSHHYFGEAHVCQIISAPDEGVSHCTPISVAQLCHVAAHSSRKGNLLLNRCSKHLLNQKLPSVCVNQLLPLFLEGLRLNVFDSRPPFPEIRETETMDRRGFYNDYESSGLLPDDEDLKEPIDPLVSDYDEDDDYSLDEDLTEEYSGSGDSDENESSVDILTTTLGNKIPEGDVVPKRKNEDDDGFNGIDNNEIIESKKSNPIDHDPSNKISMAITGNGGFFQKKEVVVALIAGTLVGLLFAVLIIVVLVMRLKRKDVNGCDPVKKPIYKKASTIEA
ncbi:syndecan 4-A-like [Pelodytes ibericus]